jgi:hypothetical protein
MVVQQDYLCFPGSTTVGKVLRTYVRRQCDWWWVLIADAEGEHTICSFGSLLPYLTGRTPHIVHSVGHCPVCSGLDPLLWRDTGTLVQKALRSWRTRIRRISDLPMAPLPVAELKATQGPDFHLWLVEQGTNIYGVAESGVLCGVNIPQTMGGLMGGPPDF